MIHAGSRAVGKGLAYCCQDYCIVERVRLPPYDLDCSCSCWAIRLIDRVKTDELDESGEPIFTETDFWFAEKPMLKSEGDGKYRQVPAAMMEGYSYSARGFNGDEPTSAGSENVGQIKLANCGEFDDFLCIDWNLQQIEIYVSDCCDKNVDDMDLIFSGVMKDLSWNSTEITVAFGDRRSAFEQAMIEEKYEGTGLLEGEESLKGKIKPKAFGAVSNVKPVRLDAIDEIYQVHNGTMQSVDEVRDRGVALTYAGDVSNILTATAPAGSYVTDLANGYIKLGSTAQGEITADVIGEIPLVQTTVDIIERIMTNCFGDSSLTYPDDFDLVSMNFLNVNTPFPIGYYISENKSMAEVLDELMKAVGGFWYVSREGKISFGLPWVQDDELCLDVDLNDIVGDIVFEGNSKASTQRTVKWNKNWTQQTDFAGGADQSLVSYWAEDGLSISSNPEEGENSIEVSSFITNEKAAQTFADALYEHYKDKRDFIQINVTCGLLFYRLSDCVTLNLDRFKITGDKNFQVIALEEDARSNCVRLRLAG